MAAVSACSPGFAGAPGIYEMIEIDDTLATMIHDGTSQPKLEKVLPHPQPKPAR